MRVDPPKRPNSGATQQKPPALAPSDDKRSVSANELRWLAEHADGWRDKELCVVWKDGKLTLVPVAAAPGGGLLNVRTGWREGGLRTQWKKVLLHLEDEHGHSQTYDLSLAPDDIADAIFLSQSAVEKFVLPYYMRFKTAGSVDQLRKDLYGGYTTGGKMKPDSAVAYHVPPSVAKAVSESDEDASTPKFCTLSLDNTTRTTV